MHAGTTFGRNLGTAPVQRQCMHADISRARIGTESQRHACWHCIHEATFHALHRPTQWIPDQQGGSLMCTCDVTGVHTLPSGRM